MAEKRHANVVVVGHCDSGKSTTTGHLLYKCGAIESHLIEKFEREATQMGRPGAKFAWVLDRLKEERERGMTIDIALHKLETQKMVFTMIDAPGHRDFIKNMITGTSQADAPLLVVSASKGEFESGMSPSGQTREHSLLTFTLGLQQILVCVSKMETVSWSQERFDEIKTEVTKYLHTVNKAWSSQVIPFVPISGSLGDNLIEPSPNLPWYEGPSLLQALENIKPPVRWTEKPLRICLQEIYKIGGTGTVPVGRIETGQLKPGMEVVFAPNNIRAEVVSIERHKEELQVGLPGDVVGFHVNNVTAKELRRGMVVSDPRNDPALECVTFVAHIIILNHPGEISVGYAPVMNCHTAHVPCRIEQIIAKLDRKAKATTEKVVSLKQGDAAQVVMRPLKPVVLEPFKTYPSLGRFALRDVQKTVAVGIVKEVTKIKPPASAR
eukprot:GEMP01027034.1.p1 GENE.GEMP01027034.1~~GEMP01027034.1.p1  ORF type:complete len:438 (+),score=87.41 GEMP01027034.1:197-1510(+)